MSFDRAALAAAIRRGERRALARAITLVESTRADHRRNAEALLESLLPETGRSVRIGISGVPGVGKSTFIEAFGQYVIDQGHKVAVLAIDPSSQRTGGSILGDKTRMEMLSRRPEAFIRPSPAGATLGGVARRTREAGLLCEAAGFDVVLIETVGVGQSETAVADMVDLFMLLLLPGGGDELQGIKKGIVEMADLVAINKADGDNRLRADLTRQEQASALHYLQPATPEWTTAAILCAGLSGMGVPEIWQQIEAFYQKLEPRGIIADRRQQQSLAWMTDLIEEELKDRFYSDPRVIAQLDATRRALLAGETTVVLAARKLLDAAASPANPLSPDTTNN